MPLVVVVGVEEHQVAREVRVHELQGEGGRQGCKEGPPHHLVWEVVRDLYIETKNGKFTIDYYVHGIGNWPYNTSYPS